MTLEELKQKYPQYAQMPDDKLATSLHRKHYSAIPFDEFAKKVGYQSQGDIDTTTGLKNLPLRIKLSFVDKPEQRETLLKSVYPETSRLPDGRLAFKNPETNKLTTVDEEGRTLRDIADWVGMLPEIAGATVGGIAGGPVPIPGARFAGAGLGYSVGKDVKTAIAGDITGEYPEETETQTIKRKVGEVATGAAMEAGGAALLKVASPLAKNITPAGKRAIKYFKQYGGKFTPAQATENRFLDLIENVAESSIFGGGRLWRFKAGQKKLSANIADDIAGRFGNHASPEEVGMTVQKAIAGKKELFNKTAQSLYSEVDELTEGLLINTKPLKEVVKKIKGEMAITDPGTNRFLKGITDLDESVPFKQMQNLRSDLLQIGYGPSDLIPGRTAGIGKKLAGTINKIFDNAEGGLSGEALESFRRANAFWKTGKETFNHEVVKSLANKAPEKVANTLFHREAVTQIKHVRRLVGKETWKKLKGQYTNKLLFKEGTTPEGIVSGKKLEVAMRNMGRPALKEIFTGGEIAELHNFINVLKMQQSKTPGLGGGMLIQLTQAGAILDLAGVMGGGAGVSKMGASILFGPAAMAQLLTRGAGIRWLTKGIVTRPGTKEATKVAGRLVALAGKENLLPASGGSQ